MKVHLLLMVAALTSAVSVSAQVPFERIQNADKEPQNWLTYNGTYSGWRYSPLDQITAANAKDLQLKWVFQARSLNPYEPTPLVVDGVLYTTQGNDVVALDATTGKMFWIYRYAPAADARFCCGGVNRGLAILGDRLFLATLDAHLIALDAKNGQPLWDVTVASAADAYSFTSAPLVVKDKVIIGPGTSEAGIRGFLAAFDAATGKEIWRFNIVPGPGEAGHETWSGDSWKHGGGGIWVTGAYDAETNLTIWGTGNPWPRAGSAQRRGDNLYTSAFIALDADTGKLKWHYQFTPHDDWDWDAVEVPILVDMPWRGTMRKLVVQGNRNGFYYMLDRGTGEFLQAKAFAKQNWNLGFDEKGKPLISEEARTNEFIVYPAVQGATNWYSPSYSPRTKLFYLSVWENTAKVQIISDTPIPPPATGTYGREGAAAGEGGQAAAIRRQLVDPSITARARGGGHLAHMSMSSPQVPNYRNPQEENYAAVRALDAQTGQLKWEFKMTDATEAGVLSTAGDVVFSGGREGYFFALDAVTGKLLWKIPVGGEVTSTISFAASGKQYVAVAAGNALFAFGLPD
jgi:alcohol dehydrogenase (cytochrome c)